MGVIRSAARPIPTIEALWSRIQSEFYGIQRPIVEALHAKKALRPGLDVARGTDILWTLNHPDLWLLLVGQRGWTPDEWEQWFGDTICAQLLAPRHAGLAGLADRQPSPLPYSSSTYAAATDLGTTIAHASSTSSRISAASIAASRTTTQL